MVKIGAFIQSVEVAVRQGAITVETSASAIQAFIEVGDFFWRRNRSEQVSLSEVVDADFEKTVELLAFAIDDILVVLGKGYLDVFEVSDQLSLGASKNLGDELALIDLQVKGITKALVEVLAVAETLAFVIDRALEDSVAPVDVLARTADKALSDAALSGDALSREATKALAEMVEMTDLVDTSLLRSDKLVADIVEVTDDLDGNATADDDQAIQFIKSLTDPVGTEDTMARVAAFLRAIEDSATAAEDLSKESTKQTSDTVGTSESGIIFWQSYADPSYFGADYVGNSVQF